MIEEQPAKMKHLKINEALHSDLKRYCQQNGLKMVFVVEKMVRDVLEAIERGKSGKQESGNSNQRKG